MDVRFDYNRTDDLHKEQNMAMLVETGKICQNYISAVYTMTTDENGFTIHTSDETLAKRLKMMRTMIRKLYN